MSRVCTYGPQQPHHTPHAGISRRTGYEPRITDYTETEDFQPLARNLKVPKEISRDVAHRQQENIREGVQFSCLLLGLSSFFG